MFAQINNDQWCTIISDHMKFKYSFAPRTKYLLIRWPRIRWNRIKIILLKLYFARYTPKYRRQCCYIVLYYIRITMYECTYCMIRCQLWPCFVYKYVYTVQCDNIRDSVGCLAGLVRRFSTRVACKYKKSTYLYYCTALRPVLKSTIRGLEHEKTVPRSPSGTVLIDRRAN